MEPTVAPSATPISSTAAPPTFTLTPNPCAVTNTNLRVNRPFGLALDTRPSWVSIPVMVNAPEGADIYAGDVFVIDTSLIVTPRQTGLMAVTVVRPGAPNLLLCFNVS